MRESAVGDVLHAERDLATHGDALADTQRRQSTAVARTCRRQLVTVVPRRRRTQERLEISLQPHHAHGRARASCIDRSADSRR